MHNIDITWSWAWLKKYCFLNVKLLGQGDPPWINGYHGKQEREREIEREREKMECMFFFRKTWLLLNPDTIDYVNYCLSNVWLSYFIWELDENLFTIQTILFIACCFPFCGTGMTMPGPNLVPGPWTFGKYAPPKYLGITNAFLIFPVGFPFNPLGLANFFFWRRRVSMMLRTTCSSCFWLETQAQKGLNAVEKDWLGWSFVFFSRFQSASPKRVVI